MRAARFSMKPSPSGKTGPVPTRHAKDELTAQMHQNRGLLTGLVLLATLWWLPGCGGDQSAQWLETAQFEERQQNVEHAKQLYEDIIREYPNSPAAATARERVAVLSRQSGSPEPGTHTP